MATEAAPAYSLLACDLDGTLMGDDTVIPIRVRSAVFAAQARGIHVTLATGRGFPETLPFAQALNIAVPIICYQGGLIRHAVTGELLFRATMPRDLVLDVIQLAHTRDWHLVVYVDDAVFIDGYRHPPSFYTDLLGLNIHRVDDLAAVIASGETDPAKFLFVAEEGDADRIYSEIETRYAQHMNVVRSHALFVEGNPLGVSKGDALRRLAGVLNVPQREVMAIGDQGNDVPMLEWAGFGVAMANASPATIAAADWIAPPLSADGAAVAIERFLLNQEGCWSVEDRAT
jgi:Cof subfamily protein (haloacid dehalogenase superfamily)